MTKRVKFVDDNETEEKRMKYFDEGESESNRRSCFIEDDIKFTTFNMKPERSFWDQDANEYIIRKAEKKQEDSFYEKDNWLDSIEDNNEFVEQSDSEDDASDEVQREEPVSNEEKVEIYSGMADCLQGNETVAQAIKRLVGKKPTKRVFKTRRTNVAEEKIEESAKSDADPSDMEKMLRLSELANRAVNEFDEYDVYSLTKTAILRKAELLMGGDVDNK